MDAISGNAFSAYAWYRARISLIATGLALYLVDGERLASATRLMSINKYDNAREMLRYV